VIWGILQTKGCSFLDTVYFINCTRWIWAAVTMW